MKKYEILERDEDSDITKFRHENGNVYRCKLGSCGEGLYVYAEDDTKPLTIIPVDTEWTVGEDDIALAATVITSMERAEALKANQ